jgi:hypothetical protein
MSKVSENNESLLENIWNKSTVILLTMAVSDWLCVSGATLTADCVLHFQFVWHTHFLWWIFQVFSSHLTLFDGENISSTQNISSLWLIIIQIFHPNSACCDAVDIIKLINHGCSRMYTNLKLSNLILVERQQGGPTICFLDKCYNEAPLANCRDNLANFLQLEYILIGNPQFG